MKWDEPIIEGIEVCRPESDDLPELADVARAVTGDPALLAYAQRVVRFDQSVREEIENVPTPAGLEERLQHAVAQARERSAEQEAAVGLAASHQPPRSRRRWLVAAAAAAACLAIAAGVWITQLGHGPWTVVDLEQAVDSWGPLLDHAKWRSTPPPVGALPDEIPLTALRWCRLRRPSSGIGNVLAFDLAIPNAPPGQRCRLFVVRMNVAGLGAIPPRNPTVTQGRLIAMWRSGDRVCVVVLSGSDADRLKSHYKRWFAGAVQSA